jgi:VanZ family protein
MKQSDRVASLWLEAFLFWFLWLTVATHIALGEPTDVEPFFEMPDKLLHFVSFGMLAFLFAHTRLIKSPMNCWMIMAIWCLFDEYSQQALPNGRSLSFQDVLAGELGIASFMFWFDALSKPSMMQIRAKVQGVLALRKNWTLLLFISGIVTLVGTGLIWYVLKVFEGRQYSSTAFFIAIILATGCVLVFIICNGNLQSEARRMVKSMLPITFVTIVIGASLGLATSFTSIDPWVVVMTVLIIGFRVAWNRAI